MVNLRTVATILVFAVCSIGQPVQRNFLSTKFSPEFVKQNLIKLAEFHPFPKTSDEWIEALPDDLRSSLIKKGEAALAKPVSAIPATTILEYVRTGNRSYFEGFSFSRRQNLVALALAESIEDKGRFTDAIANYVWAICEETYWGVPAHLSIQKAGSGLPDIDDHTVDLFTAETAAALALTDYFVGEKLDKVSPLLRKRIYSETNAKLFEPIKDSQRYSWLNPKKAVNNWNPWIISNAITADLLIEHNDEKRADNLSRYMAYLDIYLNGLGDEGGCDEGPSYWFAAGGSVFDSLELLASASHDKISIFDNPLIAKMASYIYKVHIGDRYFVNFADADPKFWVDGYLLYRFGKAVDDERLRDFGVYFINRDNFLEEDRNENGFFKTRHVFDLLAAKVARKEKATYKPSPEAWFSDIQVMTARTDRGLFLATHAGHNAESHNHNDVGDFIVYFQNEPVIIDAGRGNYTAKTFSSKRYELWFTQSEFHNLPIINGLGQHDGRSFEATGVEFLSNQSKVGLKMNIAKAYPKEAA